MRRITMLGDFWKHLQTSGYGAGNEQYCKMLCERLEFHRKVRRDVNNTLLRFDKGMNQCVTCNILH